MMVTSKLSFTFKFTPHDVAGLLFYNSNYQLKSTRGPPPPPLSKYSKRMEVSASK